eukprot:CAMPEP_0115555942 /NCGR_PEP_ID=MMETSP0271-20121206/98087_1 /TAXON_ID=71861 /ORGANISM="Scrippsiella trochoidea, Strain CCMP3099" /LENGTH=69 /DNA_ID=CAMNT_0002989751 /DNA_START=115 /DNA_END=321 /DNA_ORIENTATION=+
MGRPQSAGRSSSAGASQSHRRRGAHGRGSGGAPPSWTEQVAGPSVHVGQQTEPTGQASKVAGPRRRMHA